MPGQITAFDIGECMVKAVCFTGGKLKKVMAKELPDNMVSGGEIVSMDAMADFIKEMAKENGISRGAAAVILPGTLVFPRNVTVPAMTDGQLLYNLPFEFKDYLTQEKNKYYFDYAVQDTVKDEEGNVKELQLFVCATLKSTVEEYRAMLRRAGFNLKVAMPEECAYAALTEDYMQRTNAPAGSDYCFVDLGHNGIRMHILQDGNFTTKRSGDLGLRDLEQTISDVRGVDIHMAHAHILSDYNDVLSEDVSAELFNRMAIEIMKAVNFYNYNNRERSLRRIYLCGGGVAVDQIRAAAGGQLDIVKALGGIDAGIRQLLGHVDDRDVVDTDVRERCIRAAIGIGTHIELFDGGQIVGFGVFALAILRPLFPSCIILGILKGKDNLHPAAVGAFRRAVFTSKVCRPVAPVKALAVFVD